MGRGGNSLLCDPGSELRLGGRENRRAKIINGMEKKQKEKKRGNVYTMFNRTISQRQTILRHSSIIAVHREGRGMVFVETILFFLV